MVCINMKNCSTLKIYHSWYFTHLMSCLVSLVLCCYRWIGPLQLPQRPTDLISSINDMRCRFLGVHSSQPAPRFCPAQSPICFGQGIVNGAEKWLNLHQHQDVEELGSSRIQRGEHNMYIWLGIVWLRALCSVWELVIEFIEVVHGCKKLCTFHRSCARFTRPLITFVFNCCGMDGSHWGLLTRLSRYDYIFVYNIDDSDDSGDVCLLPPELWTPLDVVWHPALPRLEGVYPDAAGE